MGLSFERIEALAPDEEDGWEGCLSVPEHYSDVARPAKVTVRYLDRDGKKQEQADFHNVVVFGRQADTVAQYLKKGASAFVEGRIQTRSWEGKDGEKKYRTEIVADRVQTVRQPQIVIVEGLNVLQTRYGRGTRSSTFVSDFRTWTPVRYDPPARA